jgi:hypothetical protein
MTGRQTPTNLPSRDWCQAGNAYVLADRIRAYWSRRGLAVTTYVATSHELGDGGCQAPGVVHCIRSDMVNGWPSKKMTTPTPMVRA